MPTNNPVKKPEPFCDAVLGDFKPDKKATNKDTLAFSRAGDLYIAEEYAQLWVDPVTFKKKWLFGDVALKEYRLVSKQDGTVSYSRHIEPKLSGGKTKDVI